MSGVAGVLAAHWGCEAEATVEVHADRTGTMHYPCGITVGPVVGGLLVAYRAHVEAAVLAWIGERLADEGLREELATSTGYLHAADVALVTIRAALGVES